jgi:two-component system response regulator FixJ
MPIMGGFELLQELNKLHNRIPIIFVTGHGTVPMAVRAMQEGAIDFITKPFNDEALLEKIQKAIIADRKRMNDANNYDYTQKLACLTPREIEVMKHISEGKLNKQIAALLNISYSTVDFHRANLMNKLQIRSVAELIKIYLTSSYST